MGVRPIRQWGDPVLRTACDPVVDFDEDLDALVTDLLDTIVAEPGRAGLAANQIGVSMRVFSFFVGGSLGHVVNPRIVAIDGEQDGDEGCLSLPGLWFPTRRAARATVEGSDRHGDEVGYDGSGLLARAFQHEVDHLDGMLFVDRLEPARRREAMRAARAL